MASLGAVVRFGGSGRTRLLSHLRKTVAVSHLMSGRSSSAGLPESLMCSYFSSEKRSNAYKFKETPTVQSATQDTDKQDKEKNPLDHETDVFDELFAASRQLFSSRFSRSCEYLLIDWERQVKLLQKAGLPVDLIQIVSKSLPEIVEFVLTPSAPPDLRTKCLSLLLSEKIDTQLTVKMLNQTVADVTYLPVKVVADVVQLLSTSSETDLRKETRIKLVTAVINNRWYEITPKHALFFMFELDELFDMRSVSQQFRQKSKHENSSCSLEEAEPFEHDKDSSGVGEIEVPLKSTNQTVPNEHIPVLSINLETRIINLASDLKAKDLARIIILCGKWRNRNETLLNAVIHCLCQACLSDFSFVQLNNLLFSISVLNIHNDDLLRKIISHLIQTTPTTPFLACSTLQSLSYLRWHDEDLISKYLHYLADHVTELRAKDAHNLLMSLANLYAVPRNEAEKDFILKLASRVFSEEFSPAVRVNCAWCLAVLISLGADLAESMLQPEFVKQFSDISDFQNQISLQKLKSVNTAFQFEVSNFSGPTLSEEFLISSEENSACTNKALTSEFVNTLRKFVDLNAYVKFNQPLKCGVVADAVMCADKSGEIKPLQAIENESDEVYKLSIQLVPFSGVLSPSQSPSGSYSMTARHLKHLGYIPVQILYSDLRKSKMTLEKVNNIRTKIKSAIADSLANQ